MLPVLPSSIPNNTSNPLGNNPLRPHPSLTPKNMPPLSFFSSGELEAHAKEAHESPLLKQKVSVFQTSMEKPPLSKEEIRAHQRRKEIKELARKHMAKIFASLPDIQKK